jgi:short-subunit dehydrogenase
MKINGSVVLVTGASSGIGAATAKAMARKGGRVLLLARNQIALEKVASDISANGREARVYPVDLTDAEAVIQSANRVTAEVGTPDIVINNAGAGRWLFTEETAPSEAVEMMAVPYFAAFFVTRAFLPGMLRRNSGYIVNVTSAAAFVSWPGAAGYTAARWAVRGFTEALRADLYGTGIKVALYASGVVRTPYFEHNPGAEERIPKMARYIPDLTAEQAANAIVQGVEQNKREIVVPSMLRLLRTVRAVAPHTFDHRLWKSGWRRPS